MFTQIATYATLFNNLLSAYSVSSYLVSFSATKGSLLEKNAEQMYKLYNPWGHLYADLGFRIIYEVNPTALKFQVYQVMKMAVFFNNLIYEFIYADDIGSKTQETSTEVITKENSKDIVKTDEIEYEETKEINLEDSTNPVVVKDSNDSIAVEGNLDSIIVEDGNDLVVVKDIDDLVVAGNSIDPTIVLEAAA